MPTKASGGKWKAALFIGAFAIIGVVFSFFATRMCFFDTPNSPIGQIICFMHGLTLLATLPFSYLARILINPSGMDALGLALASIVIGSMVVNAIIFGLLGAGIWYVWRNHVSH